MQPPSDGWVHSLYVPIVPAAIAPHCISPRLTPATPPESPMIQSQFGNIEDGIHSLPVRLGPNKNGTVLFSTDLNGSKEDLAPVSHSPSQKVATEFKIKGVDGLADIDVAQSYIVNQNESLPLLEAGEYIL